MKFKVLLGLVFVLIVSCKPTIKNDLRENKQNLESKIDSLIGKEFNGVVFITKDQVPIYSKAFGYSDLEEKVPLQIKDQFVIGSVSKQITSVLVLRAYEEGSLDLDDTVGGYLSNIKPSWSDKVTIHHLLTHTHGITDLNQNLAFEPGMQFQYSQLGYDLLAKVLEAITQKTFNQLSRDLFSFFELKDTFHPDHKSYKNLVKGYEQDENGKLIICLNSLKNYPAAGSFISNVHDLARWNQLLHNHKLVKKKTLEIMKQRYATRMHPIFETVEYGYGLLFKKGENNIEIGALGYAPGFVSASYYYPETNMSLVVLENTAKELHDFKKTFKTHTELMKAIKTIQKTE